MRRGRRRPAEQREVLADEAAGADVDEEARVGLVDDVEHDPLPRLEARAGLGVGGGGGPAVVDGAEVHVVVEVVVGQEAVGDAVDEVRRERRPACHFAAVRCGGLAWIEDLDSVNFSRRRGVNGGLSVCINPSCAA